MRRLWALMGAAILGAGLLVPAPAKACSVKKGFENQFQDDMRKYRRDLRKGTKKVEGVLLYVREVEDRRFRGMLATGQVGEFYWVEWGVPGYINTCGRMPIVPTSDAVGTFYVTMRGELSSEPDHYRLVDWEGGPLSEAAQ